MTFNLVVLLGCVAAALNVTAVGSGWLVFFMHPDLLRKTVGQHFNTSPAYLCCALVTLTTAMSMYLMVLLAWWFTHPEIRSPFPFVGGAFMFYHILTGVVATATHVTIQRVAGKVLGPPVVRGRGNDPACKGLPQLL